MFLSRHVEFVESSFPFVSLTLNDQSSQPKNDLNSPVYITDTITNVLPCSSTLDTNVTSVVPSSVTTEAPALDPSSGNDSQPSVPHLNTNSPSHIPSQTIRTHPMITCSQNNIYKPKHAYLVSRHSLSPSFEPTSASQAV